MSPLADDAPLPGAASRRTRLPAAVAYPAVFVIGFTARLAQMVVGGTLGGLFTHYDPAVYYAAADALTFGRLPYRDFVLVHPPASTVLLTPFAALGRLTGDHIGLATAMIAFMLIGAVNAVLTMRVARVAGLGLPAATLAGLFSAVWAGAVWAEQEVRLEPLGNLFLLCGLLCYLRAARWATERTDKRGIDLRFAIAGAAFGVAASVKIWWFASLVALLLWQLTAHRRRRLLPIVLGAGAALLVINGPFLLAAPGMMWHSVLRSQVGRGRLGQGLGEKLRDLLGGFAPQVHALSDASLIAVATIAIAVLASLAVAAWQHHPARFAVVLLAVHATVLALAPTWFAFYADYLTPALALTLGAAFQVLCGSRCRAAPHPTAAARPMRAATLLPVAILLVATAALGQLSVTLGSPSRPFPRAELSAAIAQLSCVISDSPGALIALDALSRDLANGCPNRIDVTGRTYLNAHRTGPDGLPLPRAQNQAWQDDLREYLTSGDAVILVRTQATGLTEATRRAITRGGVLARAGGFTLYRTG